MENMQNPEIVSNGLVLWNTFGLIILSILAIIKLYLDWSLSKKNKNDGVVNSDLILKMNETLTKIEETLAQEKVIDSMVNMAEIQKCTIEMIKGMRRGKHDNGPEI